MKLVTVKQTVELNFYIDTDDDEIARETIHSHPKIYDNWYDHIVSDEPFEIEDVRDTMVRDWQKWIKVYKPLEK